MSPTGGRKLLTAPYLLRMAPGLKKALEVLAKADRRGLGDYIRVTLEDHVARKRK